MMPRAFLVVAAAGALAAGAMSCASSRSAAVTAADTLPVVTLSRGACYGTCPIYALRLFDDGRTVFTGERFVRVVGSDTAHVSRDAVDALRRAFTAHRFDALPPVIERGTALCGAYAADLPTVQLGMRQADSLHTVRFDGGCMDHPRWLDSLAVMVDSVAGTTRWIDR